VIVNADDFGFSDARNTAVVRAFAEGLISSATLMATRSELDGACDLVRSGRLERCVGLHLVLTEDIPLTDACRRCAAVCGPDGRFLPELDTLRLLRLGADGRRTVLDELRAQALRCRERGVPLTHIDSHHHVHAHPALIGVVIALARELRIPGVRLARNCDPRTRAPRRLAHAYVNRTIRRAVLARTRWFGRVEDFEALRARSVSDADDIEVMVHPDLSPGGELVDTGGLPLAELVARLGTAQPVSYAGEPSRPRRASER
jgi:predicted glycoside hydrolase/deacetylase ChbG (UPF0249 family)